MVPEQIQAHYCEWTDCVKGMRYLSARDGGPADAGADRAPGAGREDAGEQRVQVSGPQTSAVPLDSLHVSLYETLP